MINIQDYILKSRLENQLDLPMVQEMTDYAADQLSRVLEYLLVTSSCVNALVEAKLDPAFFHVEGCCLQSFAPGNILMFEWQDDQWLYRVAGTMGKKPIPLYDDSGSIIGYKAPSPNTESEPIVDVMRKACGQSNWQIWKDGAWVENGPPMGF